MTTTETLPPVIMLGGESNGLAVARSLGAMGVAVYGLGASPHVARSRYVRALPLPPGPDPEAAMASALLGPATEHLRGAVVLATNDPGISVLARNRTQLLERFLLDNSDPGPQLAMLDKLSTYQQAEAAGVPTPRFWQAHQVVDIERIRDELTFPLIVKPLISHHYQDRFPTGGKFRVVSGIDELRQAYRELTVAGLAVMLVEKIPGPDNLLCSYYTYLDRSGDPTFDFTKRILRRHPPNMGAASYHVTDWNPEVRDLSLRLFKQVGLRGVANAEFKRDLRDGRLKLIECNARFTASNCLLASAGVDLARHVYLQALGRPEAMPDRYKTGMRLLLPSTDLLAFLALRRVGELTLAGWLRSLLFAQTFPWLRLNDPMPALSRATAVFSRGMAVSRSLRASAERGEQVEVAGQPR